MSKQAEAINVYIEQQQKKINELVQQNMMLETRNNILLKEVEELKNINKTYKDEIDAISFERNGVSTLVTNSNLRTRNETIEKQTSTENKIKLSGKEFTKNNMLRRE